NSVAATALYLAGAAPTTLSSLLTVTDPDNLNLAGATVHITDGAFGDLLAANTTGTAIMATYNAVNQTLVLTGSDTLAHYQQVLPRVTSASTNANPAESGFAHVRHIDWQVDDGTGAGLSFQPFQPLQPVTGPGSPASVAIGDFNGDGKADLVIDGIDTI